MSSSEQQPVAWLVGHVIDPVPLRVGCRVVLGRSPAADVTLLHRAVSREHAVIEVAADGAVSIRDQSTYGTCVNGKRIQTTALEVGDQLTIGSFDFLVQSGQPASVEDHDITIMPAASAGRTADSAGLTGSLRRTPLEEVLQGFEFHRKTGVLTVESSGQAGRLVVRDGQPLEASFLGQADGDAVVGMLALQDGQFSFVDGLPGQPAGRMNTTFAELLEDARTRASLRDFARAGDGGEPHADPSTARPVLVVADLELQASDRTLLRFLFRNCEEVRLKPLAGGFSGNVVVATESVDQHGHEQAPHVVKIGPVQAMREERDACRSVHEVLGNTVPQISAFAELNERGAIKYRYASMGGRFSTTYQERYMQGMPGDVVRNVLDTVFREQLMRLYRAGTREDCNLLELYDFSPKWAEAVRGNVESLVGAEAGGPMVEVIPGVRVTNPAEFYSKDLNTASPQVEPHYQAFVHGDLNGGNIILDGRENVWLIDFSHSRRSHVLKDLIKFENDLLFIHTPIAGEAELREALPLTDRLLDIADVTCPPDGAPPSGGAELRRAWETACILRGYYAELVPGQKHPRQLWIGMLRYAVHTLGFSESNEWQRRWALYTAGRCVELLRAGDR